MTTRIHYTTLPKRITVSCMNCETDQQSTAYEDEDTREVYGELHTTKCSLLGCKKQLCSNCPQFECAFCHQTFCRSHAVLYSGNTICLECMAEEVDEEARRASDLLEQRT